MTLPSPLQTAPNRILEPLYISLAGFKRTLWRGTAWRTRSTWRRTQLPLAQATLDGHHGRAAGVHFSADASARHGRRADAGSLWRPLRHHCRRRRASWHRMRAHASLPRLGAAADLLASSRLAADRQHPFCGTAGSAPDLISPALCGYLQLTLHIYVATTRSAYDARARGHLL